MKITSTEAIKHYGIILCLFSCTILYCQIVNPNMPDASFSTNSDEPIISESISFGSIVPLSGYLKTNGLSDFGFVSIIDPSVFNFLYNSSTGNQGAAAIDPSGDHIYIFSFSTIFSKIDLETGEETILGPIEPPPSHQWEGADFDPISGDLYVVASEIESTNSSLFILDIELLTLTFVGNLNFDTPQGLEFDDQGNLYSFGNDDMFYMIDKTNGNPTLIGNLGYNVHFYQGLGWNPNNQTMYINAFNVTNGSTELRIVDLTTGVSSLIGEITPGDEDIFGWISFDEKILGYPDFASHPRYILVENPVSEFINLKLNASFDYNNVSIKVFNVSGKEVLKYDVSSVSNLISLKFNLDSGTYFLNIKDSKGLYNLKLIVK